MRLLKNLLILYLSLSLFGFIACSKSKEKPSENVYSEKDSKIIVTIDDTSITATEFIDFFNSRPKVARWSSKDGGLDPNQILQAFIDKILILKEAKSLGTHNSSQVIKQKQIFENKQAINLLIKKHINPMINIDEASVLAQIPKSKQREVKFKRILVLSEDKAKDLEKQLKNGILFDELVQAHSVGQEASQKGELEFLNPHMGIYPKDVINTIFNLKLFETSPPMKIREGYAIFQPIAERMISPLDLKPVLDYQRSLLFKTKQKQLLNDYISELKSYQNVKIDEKTLIDLFNKLKNGKDLGNYNPIIVQGKNINNYWNEIQSSIPKVNNSAIDQNWIWNITNNLINKRLLYLEAQNMGLDKTDDVQTESRRFMDDIISKKLINDKIENNIDVSDKNCREYYQSYYNNEIIYDEIKSSIKQKLIQQQKEKNFKKFISILRNKAEIDINKEIFNKIKKAL